jgi:hypothetical protein
MKNHLYRFAHSPRILTPFVKHYGCGWFDGGCFIFARALQLWLGGRLAVLVRQELLHEQAFDHALLSLSDVTDFHEPLYVDADGVATAHDLLECWRTRNRLRGLAWKIQQTASALLANLKKSLGHVGWPRN